MGLSTVGCPNGGLIHDKLIYRRTQVYKRVFKKQKEVRKI